VAVHLNTRIKRIEGNPSRATAVVLPDGTQRQFDFIIVAVPWGRVCSLFPQAMLASMPALDGVENIRPAPITAVHLWFDRPITTLPHAVLIEKLGQWVFNGGQNALHDVSGLNHYQNVLPDVSEPSHYYQVVISASHGLIGRRREDVLAEVRHDLEAIWPEARRARLLHWRTVTRAAAVFSVAPGVERFRPVQQTPIENLMLAGDWTMTGWPATMEGAVRSGYLAVEGILRQLGRDVHLLAPANSTWTNQ
jgi:uncharacterized protein with NAD-binding domain and iron-sulfur cluster